MKNKLFSFLITTVLSLFFTPSVFTFGPDRKGRISFEQYQDISLFLHLMSIQDLEKAGCS